MSTPAPGALILRFYLLRANIFYVWHIPWSHDLSPRLLHERDVPDGVCDNLAIGDLVGCVSSTPTAEIYIYLFNWKTSQDALIKVQGPVSTQNLHE